MTLFSNCAPVAGMGRRGLRSRRGRSSNFAGFMEDVAILFRYAIGLDYYDRHRVRFDG